MNPPFALNLVGVLPENDLKIKQLSFNFRKSPGYRFGATDDSFIGFLCVLWVSCLLLVRIVSNNICFHKISLNKRPFTGLLLLYGGPWQCYWWVVSFLRLPYEPRGVQHLLRRHSLAALFPCVLVVRSTSAHSAPEVHYTEALLVGFYIALLNKWFPDFGLIPTMITEIVLSVAMYLLTTASTANLSTIQTNDDTSMWITPSWVVYILFQLHGFGRSILCFCVMFYGLRRYAFDCGQ